MFQLQWPDIDTAGDGAHTDVMRQIVALPPVEYSAVTPWHT